MMRVMAFVARRFPDRLVAQATAALPPPDAELMRNPAFGLGFARLVAEAANQGPRGPRLDTALMVEPWGFDPARIEIPVRIWHGEEDRNAPIEMGRYLTETIPGARAMIVPEHGHLSLFYHRADEILREIAGSFDSD
jgi:pimeloyl-ACP methyl ester carboxylesterase